MDRGFLGPSGDLLHLSAHEHFAIRELNLGAGSPVPRDDIQSGLDAKIRALQLSSAVSATGYRVGDLAAVEVDQVAMHLIRRGSPAISPSPEGEQHIEQILALGGQQVFIPGRVVLIAMGLENPGGHEAIESLGEDVPSDPEIFLPVVKPPHAQERITKDQEAPPVADDVESIGDRAVQVLEILSGWHETHILENWVAFCNVLWLEWVST
jgi:hypothetical protein